MHQKKRKFFILFLVITLLLATIAYTKFKTINFIKTGIAFTKISTDHGEVIMIDDNPKIYLSSPHDSMNLLKEFMEKEGYDYKPNERLSSTLVFQKNDEKVYIEFSVNQYYGLWQFQE